MALSADYKGYYAGSCTLKAPSGPKRGSHTPETGVWGFGPSVSGLEFGGVEGLALLVEPFGLSGTKSTEYFSLSVVIWPRSMGP